MDGFVFTGSLQHDSKTVSGREVRHNNVQHKQLQKVLYSRVYDLTILLSTHQSKQARMFCDTFVLLCRTDSYGSGRSQSYHNLPSVTN